MNLTHEETMNPNVSRARAEWEEMGLIATDTAMALAAAGICPDALADKFENGELN
ncbi:hypothetical protein [Microbulbifer discodermiae]|uniref:hypothetical protein n=1 Tax=Microbulbifer sp. 2201CG32-9 TaxID=3232309 RepID=UPI00345BF555